MAAPYKSIAHPSRGFKSAKATEQHFYYSASHDIIKEIIKVVVALVFFGLMEFLFSLVKNEDFKILAVFCTWTYIIIALLSIISSILYLYSNTYKCLSIGTNKIVYQSGWITKHTTTIPANKIRTCSKSSTLLQRCCDSMSICITTTGDQSEIYFCDIKNGEKAFLLINNLIQKE